MQEHVITRGLEKYFCATRMDLEPGILVAEKALRLKYINDCERLYMPEYTVYYSALDIPGLGTTQGSGVNPNNFTTYLVFERDADVEMIYQPVDPDAGESYWRVSSDVNPHAFLFNPGGWYIGTNYVGEYLIGGYIIGGRVDPQREDPAKIFAKHVIGSFKTLPSTQCGRRRWKVGPEAYGALERGVRLITESIHWPARDDVQLPGNLENKKL